MQDEKKLDISSGDSSSKAEETALPISGDEELGQGNDIPPEDGTRKSIVNDFLDKLFGSDYNPTEVKYVIFAACLIALNAGFINGVTMSGLFVEAKAELPSINPCDEMNSTDTDNSMNTTDPCDAMNSTDTDNSMNSTYPDDAMIAGVAGSYTRTARALIEHDWNTYTYHLCLILSYMCGVFIAAMISPHAKSYVIEPRYGPTFMVGGTMLLAASLLAKFGEPCLNRYVFYLATASNGVQNGIASIYSANLIRCTLTGATTDIAIVIAHCIHGNYKGLARGAVLGAIVFFFWIGGLIGFTAVTKFKAATLLFNAFLFYLVGITLVYYLVKEVGVSVYDAIFGTWKWKKVLKKLNTGDGDLTRNTLMDIFDQIDAEGNSNGVIEADELRDGLRRAKVQMSYYETKTLLRAADENGDGVVDRTEWEKLAKKIL